MRGGFWIWILILIRLYGKNYFLVYIVVFLFFFLNEFASSIRKKEKRYGRL